MHELFPESSHDATYYARRITYLLSPACLSLISSPSQISPFYHSHPVHHRSLSSSRVGPPRAHQQLWLVGRAYIERLDPAYTSIPVGVRGTWISDTRGLRMRQRCYSTIGRQPFTDAGGSTFRWLGSLWGSSPRACICRDFSLTRRENGDS
jgi:hypothetical protein